MGALRSAANRAVVGGEHLVKAGRLTIDLATRNVLIGTERIQLSPKEYRLLQTLAQHSGNVVTHQQLLKEVWGIKHQHRAHYLRIFVRKLRQKIEEDPTQPRILMTELGVGYRLAPHRRIRAKPVNWARASAFSRRCLRRIYATARFDTSSFIGTSGSLALHH